MAQNNLCLLRKGNAIEEFGYPHPPTVKQVNRDSHAAAAHNFFSISGFLSKGRNHPP
jgi:hypothetical protein